MSPPVVNHVSRIEDDADDNWRIDCQTSKEYRLYLYYGFRAETGDGPMIEEPVNLDIQTSKDLIKQLPGACEDGARIEEVQDMLSQSEFDAEEEIKKLRRRGEIYNPDDGLVKVVV